MTAGGKKYPIQCPCCGRRTKSKKPLSDWGLATLKENEYLYQRCDDCQDKPMTEHEKITLEL
jgi:hypothetical protein